MHSPPRPIALAAVLVALMVIHSSAGTGGVVGHMEHELPRPVAMTCAVYTGIVVYVFGGATEGDLLDTIYAVDPGSGRTTVLPYKLPSPRKLASAVWTGKEAYIIGGIGFDAEPIAEIVKFVPGEGATVVEGAMPYGTKGIPSVWDGEAVHVLGNCLSSEVGHNDVIRFDPRNGTSEVLEDVLPIPGAGSTAVWAGNRAYIVGGRQNLTTLSDRIIEYIPGVGAKFVDGKLPLGRIGAACAWDGERLYAFGGTIALECGPLECVPIGYLDEVVVYDPALDICHNSSSVLHEPMDARAALFTPSDERMGDRVLIPGGLTASGPVERLTIFYIDPPEEGRNDTPEALRYTRFVNRLAIALLVLFLLGMAYYVLVDPFIKRWREERTDPAREDRELNE